MNPPFLAPGQDIPIAVLPHPIPEQQEPARAIGAPHHPERPLGGEARAK